VLKLHALKSCVCVISEWRYGRFFAWQPRVAGPHPRLILLDRFTNTPVSPLEECTKACNVPRCSCCSMSAPFLITASAQRIYWIRYAGFSVSEYNFEQFMNKQCFLLSTLDMVYSWCNNFCVYRRKVVSHSDTVPLCVVLHPFFTLRRKNCHHSAFTFLHVASFLGMCIEPLQAKKCC